MKNISNWIKNHIVITWAVISCIFAIIVHVVFSISAPTDWLVAKWSAGDILTFIGTVSLGLLAVWQNKRFKEENDISQQRLENIIAQSNELVAINKIIEIESARLERLRKAFDEFSSACDPQSLSTICIDKNGIISDEVLTLGAMIAFKQRLDDSFRSLSRELRMDEQFRKNDKHPLKNSYTMFYLKTGELVDLIKESTSEERIALLLKLVKFRDDFIKEREDYLISKERKLHKVIYGNLSLQEIKSIYQSD